jgi:hypothetical protein
MKFCGADKPLETASSSSFFASIGGGGVELISFISTRKLLIVHKLLDGSLIFTLFNII